MMNKNDELLSKYNPYLSFKSETATNVNDIRKIKKYAEVDSNNYISDLDFMSIKFSLFYTHLLQDINRDENGSVVFPIKYCITIDPFLCTKICATTKIKYDEICLGKTPVLYYIFIDITDIMKFARQSEKKLLM